MSSPTYDPVPTGSYPDPAGRRTPGPRVAWRGIVLENLVVVVVFAVAGAAAGWCWERWATPASGAVVDGTWKLGYRVEGDFFVGDPDSFTRAFGVVGTFMLVGALTGLVLGVLVALLCRRSELVSVVVVAASSALAVFVCYRVGLALGPPDPTTAKVANGTMLDGDLSIDQLSPFVVLPLAALVGLTVSYLFTSGVSAGVDEARRVELPAPAAPPAPHPL